MHSSQYQLCNQHAIVAPKAGGHMQDANQAVTSKQDVAISCATAALMGSRLED
jgi:hypothetical protein